MISFLNLINFVGKEIQFHTPADHKFNGKSFDMEIQIIFYPISQGDFNKKAVLSLLVKQRAGFSNKFFDKMVES